VGLGWDDYVGWEWEGVDLCSGVDSAGEWAGDKAGKCSSKISSGYAVADLQNWTFTLPQRSARFLSVGVRNSLLKWINPKIISDLGRRGQTCTQI
jgi:hypothetical protein